jgi:hypothetical protein
MISSNEAGLLDHRALLATSEAEKDRDNKQKDLESLMIEINRTKEQLRSGYKIL